jgi:hypothetical protein
MLPVLALASACSTSDKSAPPGPDAGPVFSGYKPEGCAYTVNPPESRAFTDLALDDAAPLADAAGAKPQRVRLGLGGGTKSGEPGYADPTTSAVFTWATDAPSRAAKVRFGTTPDALTQVRAGYVWANTPTALGGGEPPANMHEVHVCGLEPGKTYYYQVGGGAPGAEVWSATQSFATPSATGRILVGVSGDSRNDVDVFRLVQTRMRDAGTQLQVLSGDFVEFGTLRAQFDQWLDAAWKDPRDPSKFLTLGQQMILPVPGNHENSSGLFFSMFALPGDGPDAESFGSFDLGPAHFVLFDDQPVASQPDSPTAKAILSFLDEDLARAESKRQSVPFLVAVHHRGELSTSKHAGESDMITARDKLFPIWDKHHVDLVLAGHDHNYERSKPVTGPASAPTVKASPTEGTTFIVCAGSGAPAYAPGKDPAPFREKNVGFGETSNLGYAGVYGLLALEGRKLTFTAYGLKPAGADDVIDTFEITR